MAEPQQSKQPTIENADDALLDARARFEQWMAEFQGEWYRPQVETAAKMLWGSQPEHVKNYIRQSKPDAAKQMDQLFEKVR